jgi:hypothetical protein
MVGSCENGNDPSYSIKEKNFLTHCAYDYLLRKDCSKELANYAFFSP